MESFFATLKTECVDRRYPTRGDARRCLFDYIEVWYNRSRHHSSLEYLNCKSQTCSCCATGYPLFAIASSTLTSLAQTILAQIGQVTVTNETDNVPFGQTGSVTDLAVTPSPIPVDIRENVQTAPYTNEDGAIATYLSADDAATMLNFDIVREPSVLPNGYYFNGRSAFALPNNTFVNSFWVSDSLGEIALTQARSEATIDHRVGPTAT